MKIWSLRTKVEVVGVLFLLLSLSIVGVLGLTRTITSSSDTVDTYIRNSNGKYWAATGANIQTAIWDLNGTGGWVEVPSGWYNLSSDLKLNNGTTLRGRGIAKTIIRQADTTTFSYGVIMASSKSNFTIQDLTVDGNEKGITSGYNCIDINKCKDFLINNVFMQHAYTNGLRIYGESKRGIITNIKGMDIEGTGQAISVSHASDCVFSNCVFWNCTGNSQVYVFDYIHGCTISGITANSSLMAMKVSGSASEYCSNNTFNNLIFRNIPSTGSEGIKLQYVKKSTFNNIFIDGGGSAGVNIYSTCDGLTLSNLYIIQSANVGLYIAGNNVSVTNAHIENSVSYGLQLTGEDCRLENIYVYNAGNYNYINTANRCSLVNCEFMSCNSYGLDLQNSNDVLISNCQFVDNTLGFLIQGCTNFTISNSQFIRTANDAILTATLSCNRYIITGCTFKNNVKGIDVGALDHNLTITDCMFWSNSGDGIECDALDSVIITGCNMYGDPFDDNIVGLRNVTGANLNMGMTII